MSVTTAILAIGLFSNKRCRIGRVGEVTWEFCRLLTMWPLLLIGKMRKSMYYGTSSKQQPLNKHLALLPACSLSPSFWRLFWIVFGTSFYWKNHGNEHRLGLLFPNNALLYGRPMTVLAAPSPQIPLQIKIIHKQTSLRRTHERFAATQGLAEWLAIDGGIHGQPGSFADKLDVVLRPVVLTIVEGFVDSTCRAIATEQKDRPPI